MISRNGQKGSGGESKEDPLPLLSLAFCFFRLYALPFGMVRVAGFKISSCSISILFQCFHDAVAEFHVIVVPEKKHLVA